MHLIRGRGKTNIPFVFKSLKTFNFNQLKDQPNLKFTKKDTLKMQKCSYTITTKNSVISSNFLVLRFCGKAQFPHSFPETMRKLCLSTKFPHQKIRWNYGIFRSALMNLRYFSYIELDTNQISHQYLYDYCPSHYHQHSLKA